MSLICFQMVNLLKIVILLLNSHLIVVNSKIWIREGQLTMLEK